MGLTSTTPGQTLSAVSNKAEPGRRELDQDDKELVQLVTTVLADSSLQQDLRLKIRREIEALLRETHEDVYCAAVLEVHGETPHEASMLDHDPQVAKLLEAMLVDPTLHTDTRMRLYHEIPQLVETAHQHSGKAAAST